MPKRTHREDFVVAIDGPAGAGKSTLARALARELDLPFVNTGSMYRALAARALARGVSLDDEAALADLARSFRFGLSSGDAPELIIDGEPANSSLSSPKVESVVSAVARHPAVRDVMRRAQRRLGLRGCVMEGRDIGTVVFPDADVKIFLSAAPTVRAGRRVLERGGSAGLAAAVGQRDSLDARTNPLEPAPDAHLIDTGALGKDEVLEKALRVLREAQKSGGGGARGEEPAR